MKLKWWNKKRTLKILSAAALVLLAVVGGVVYFLSSPDFEEFGADYVVGWIEERTGTAATLERFDADFRLQRFTLEGLVLRGEEDPSGPPPRLDRACRYRVLMGKTVSEGFGLNLAFYRTTRDLHRD